MKELYWSGMGVLKSCALVNKYVSYDFIFTTATYSGFLMSSIKRLVEEEINIIERLKAKMTMLNYDEPYMVIKSYQKDYPEILETRVVMTQFTTNDCKTLGVIWFDDGTKNLTDSIKEVYEKLDWEQGRNFEY